MHQEGKNTFKLAKEGRTIRQGEQWYRDQIDAFDKHIAKLVPLEPRSEQVSFINRAVGGSVG